MDKDKRNRIILASIIIIMLIVVIIVSIYTILKKKKDDDKLHVAIVELYSSDYNMIKYGDYFYGVADNAIYSVISSEGKELYLTESGLKYKGFFETREGNYIIYNNEDDSLNAYVFDGSSFEKIYSIDNVKYAKPIVLSGKGKDYILGFCSNDDDNLYLYNKNVGIVVLSNTSLMADQYDQTKDLYYTNTEYLVVKNDEGMMGLVDTVGNLIIDFKYKNIIGTKENSYIVVNKNDTYNVIDKDGNTFLKNNYQYINYKDGYYFVVKNNKVALYDNELNSLSGFIMDSNIKEYVLRETDYYNVKKVNNIYYIWNNDGILDFTYNDVYLINNNKVKDKYSFTDFGVSDYIYSFDDNNLILYDDSFDVVREYKIGENVGYITNITKVEEDIIFIEYIESQSGDNNYFYINYDGKILDKGYGKLVRKTDNYFVYGNKEKYTIVGNDGEILNSISGEKKKIYGDTIVVDKNLYKIVIK